MNYTSILAGLPEIKAFWTAQSVLSYLLFLGILDIISGFYISGVVETSEVFSLPRSGYSKWYHRAMLRNSCILCLMISIVAIICCCLRINGPKFIWISAILLSLNEITLTSFQMLIILLSKKISVGFITTIFIQFIAIFISEQLPDILKYLLVGNWGMLERSSLITSNGYSAKIVVLIETSILIILWNCGWRIIRKNRRNAKWMQLS